jgi:transposase
MGVPRKKYTAEFKREAVRLVLEGNSSIAQVARELGISDTMLHRWKQEFEHKQEHAFPGHGHTPEDELTKLRREVDALRREKEILKKAVGIFSQHLP